MNPAKARPAGVLGRRFARARSEVLQAAASAGPPGPPEETPRVPPWSPTGLARHPGEHGGSPTGLARHCASRHGPPWASQDTRGTQRVPHGLGETPGGTRRVPHGPREETHTGHTAAARPDPSREHVEHPRGRGAGPQPAYQRRRPRTRLLLIGEGLRDGTLPRPALGEGAMIGWGRRGGPCRAPGESGFQSRAGLSPSMFRGQGGLRRAGSGLHGRLHWVLRAVTGRRADRK